MIVFVGLGLGKATDWLTDSLVSQLQSSLCNTPLSIGTLSIKVLPVAAGGRIE